MAGRTDHLLEKCETTRVEFREKMRRKKKREKREEIRERRLKFGGRKKICGGNKSEKVQSEKKPGEWKIEEREKKKNRRRGGEMVCCMFQDGKHEEG